jgi:hypothetical protein
MDGSDFGWRVLGFGSLGMGRLFGSLASGWRIRACSCGISGTQGVWALSGMFSSMRRTPRRNAIAVMSER